MNILENSSTLEQQTIDILNLPAAGEVIEWSFKYHEESIEDNLPYNSTFFEKIGGISYQQWKDGKIDPKELIEKIQDTFTSWQDTLKLYMDSIPADGTKKNKIICEGLQSKIDSLEMARISVSIELEKSSTKKLMTTEARDTSVTQINKLQIDLYGERLSENKEEIQFTLKLMRKEWREIQDAMKVSGKDYLTPEEKQEFKDIYDALVSKVTEKFPDEKYESIDYRDSGDLYEKPPEIIELENRRITREEYIPMLQGYIDANAYLQKVVQVDGATSIYDGPNSLEIPRSKNYDTKSIMEVLILMAHEIGAHYANQDISEKAGFKIRGKGNVEKEEGLAFLIEGLLMGKNLEQLKEAGLAYPYVLTGELLGEHAGRRITDLRTKYMSKGSHGDTNGSRFFRSMRGFPLDSLYPQLKDLTYGRGIIKIILLIQSGKFSLLDFFAGKFGIEDIKNGITDELVPKDKRPTFPLLFPEMLLFMYTRNIAKIKADTESDDTKPKRKRERINHEEFVTYITNKYRSVLKKEELESLKIEAVTNFTKLKTFATMWKTISKRVGER